jgi:hypothetical protein
MGLCSSSDEDFYVNLVVVGLSMMASTVKSRLGEKHQVASTLPPITRKQGWNRVGVITG